MTRLVHISRSVLLVAATVGLSAIQEAAGRDDQRPIRRALQRCPEFGRPSSPGKFIRFGCCGGAFGVMQW